jgi:hypothetical protein
MAAAGPVRMLSVVGAENSRIVLFAMAANSVDKFRMKLRRSSGLDEVLRRSVDFLSLALAPLINASGLSTKFSGRCPLFIHHPAKQ